MENRERRIRPRAKEGLRLEKWAKCFHGSQEAAVTAAMAAAMALC